MKLKTLFVLFFVLAVGAVSASAQQPVSRPAAGATAAPTSAAAADVKIAVVYTEAFGEPKAGITRLVSAAQGIEREFQPRSTEIQTLQQNLQKLADDIQKTATVSDPAAIQRKRDQAEQIQLDIKRKQEDAQRAYERRAGEVLAPVQTNINQALVEFARQRGYTMVLNGSQMDGTMILINQSLDITRDFIADYNRRNPATAAAATPARP